MKTEPRYPWIWPAIAFGAIAISFVSVGLRSMREESLGLHKSLDLDLIHTMRLALLASSEAQYSSLITRDTQRAQELARQSEHNFEALKQARTELEAELPTQIETRYMQRIDSCIAALEKLRTKLSGLSSQNTNRRAYDLATGSGFDLLQEIDREVQNWIESPDLEPRAAERKSLYELRLSLLRIQSLLIPHIFEQEDERMSQLEADMQAERNRIDKSLQELATNATLLEQRSWLASKLDRYWQLNGEIIELSRANSNIQSESLALNEYRDAQLDCESALVDLQKQIEALIPASVIPKGRM
jgi:hypothetical protein